MSSREKFQKFFVWKNVPTKKHIFSSWQGIEDQPVSSDCMIQTKWFLNAFNQEARNSVPTEQKR